jgi:MFS family permease
MKAPGRVPELLRQREFRRYWSAQTISMFGDQVSSVAIPYTGILALHADAAEMGFLTAAIWLPSLIFALHAGAWADRFGHRRILMITADLGRAGLRWRSRSAP